MAAQQQEINHTIETNEAFGGDPRNIRGVNRTCDLRSILRPEHQHLRATFITIAEQHDILARDAYNLINMHIKRFMRAICDYVEHEDQENNNWTPNFSIINMQGGGIQPAPGGQQVMPGQELVIPPVTNQSLWTWAYKLVSVLCMVKCVYNKSREE